MYLITTRVARPPAAAPPRAPVSTQVYTLSQQRPPTFNRRAQPTYVLTAIVWEEETTQISIAAIVLRALIR